MEATPVENSVQDLDRKQNARATLAQTRYGKKFWVSVARLLRVSLLPKTFLIMTFGWYQAGGHGAGPFKGLLMAFAAIGLLLWSGLYALNHWSDMDEDAKHPEKVDRPLASGYFAPGLGLGIAVILVTGGIILAFNISSSLGILAGLMLASQVAYSLRPFRFKHRAIIDVLLIGAVNPTMRFSAGYLMATRDGQLHFPMLAVGALVSVHMSGALSQRLVSREWDLAVGWNTTGTRLPAAVVAALAGGFATIGALSVVVLSLAGVLGLPRSWGSLPVYTLLVMLPLVLFIPSLANMLLRPAKHSLRHIRAVGWSVFALIALAEGCLLLVYPR